MRYALIDSTGIVENVILWDGNSETWAPPSGYTAVQSDTAQIGWTYSDGTFSAPPVPPPSLDDVKTAQIATLAQACSEQITGGFTSAALGATYTYPSKQTDPVLCTQ